MSALETLRTDVTAEDWLAPGRKSLTGYLHVVWGPRKMRGRGIFDHLIADAVDKVCAERGRPGLPRYPDLHAVWFDFDPTKEPGHQMVRPFLRYKASRPIDGLRRECSGHRVELTCSIGKDARWSNGLGAYITRAVGRCLECRDA